MRRIILGLLALAFLAPPAAAQTAIVYYINAQGQKVAVTPTTPLPTSGGGGGGGAGDASATKQDTQITAANLANARLGDVTSPGTGSVNARLEQVRAAVAALGTPLSSGGTVNLGTIGGAATSAKQDSLLAALGTPLQAGGAVSISNSPTVNLGTIGTAATATNQATANASLATIATNTGAATTAGENHIGELGGRVAVVGAAFTRPANTTAYAANQLMANSTTAVSVAPVAAAACRVNQGHGTIVRASFSISDPLAYNHAFRLHIFKTSPTSTVGDGGTWAGSVNIVGAIERATMDVTLADKGSDGAKGFGAPNAGSVIGFDCGAASSNIYVLVETLDAYTPTSGATITPALEVVQD